MHKERFKETLEDKVPKPAGAEERSGILDLFRR